MLDEKLQIYTSKFFIFLEYKKPLVFFHSSFHATLFFLLMNVGRHTLGHFLKWERKKNNLGFCIKNKSISESYLWSFSSSTNPECVRSANHQLKIKFSFSRSCSPFLWRWAGFDWWAKIEKKNNNFF